MSYVQSGNILNYFMPNIPLAETTAGVMGEMDIGAASGDHGEMICTKACSITSLGFILVGELAGGTSVAPQVLFKKRPTPLSATDESTIATVIVPDTTAIGKAVVKSDLAFDMNVGDSMEISWVIGTGTPTGIGFWFGEAADKPEIIGNNTDVSETA